MTKTDIIPGTLVIGNHWSLSARKDYGVGLVVACLPDSDDHVTVMWSVTSPSQRIIREHFLDLQVVE